MSLTPVINLLDETSNAILDKANYKTAYTDIPNDHPAVATAQEMLAGIASELGIDYSLTGSTYTVATKAGEKNVYMPSIYNYKGQACIKWGNVYKPLKDVKVGMAVVEQNKRLLLQFQLQEGDLYLSLMVARDEKDSKKLVADQGILSRALRDFSIGKYLSQAFVKPKSLVELAVGETYTVTEYKAGEFQGKRTFNIYILEMEAWYKANGAVTSVLEYFPVVTEDKPASLTTGEVTRYVSGHPVVPVEFVTALKTEAPLFDFD